MVYAAMIFFVLAVVTGLFGFTSFEGGGQPGAAAMARLFAIIFAGSFAIAGLSLLVRRYRSLIQRNDGGDAAPRPTLGGGMGGIGAGWSASERGSWDGSRRRGARAVGSTHRRSSQSASGR